MYTMKVNVHGGHNKDYKMNKTSPHWYYPHKSVEKLGLFA